ncbi:hypothetical protein [Vibrio breoganii]|uniref:hypothetical protein n=1 Tax=Vibrio breoganii TaxID=553239 RepID=UPI0012FFE4A1|nr:hypothetical protein [Vibrio breoganii]
MKVTIKNDLHKLPDDDVFVVLFFIAVVSVLGTTLFRDNVLSYIELVVQWLV